MVTDMHSETQSRTAVQTSEVLDHETDQETRQRLEQWQAMAQNLQVSGFTQMPNAVRRDPTLSTSAKLVYEHLLGYMWNKEWCWPGQQRIAAELGISRRTVIRACNELYERGYIEVWRRGLGRTNVYFVNPLSFVAATPGALTHINLQRPADRPLATDSELSPLYNTAYYANDPLTPSVCQNVTSGNDNLAQPEAPECHSMQTKEKQHKEKERDSKFSTHHKEGVLEGTQPSAGTGHPSEENQERRTEGRKQQQQATRPTTKPNHQPNHQDQAAAARAGAISRAEAEREQSSQAAAISATTGIPAEHLKELGIAPEPRRRHTPDFIASIMHDYTRDLGDTKRSAKSNGTRAAKIYYLLYDYCDGFAEQAQEYFTQLLAEAKQTALGLTNIQHRNGDRFNRIPAFFACLENRLGLTSEEREYLRSDAPLLYPEQ
jgi:hypothetical protein